MSEDLFDSLEKVLETEPFVIIDACAFQSTDGYGKTGFLQEVYDFKNIISVPIEIVERQQTDTERAIHIMEKPSAYVTQQVRNEIERNISKIQHALKRKTESGRIKRIKDYEEHTSPMSTELSEQSFQLLKQLKTKTMRFQDRQAYETLFQFFAELSEIDHDLNSKRKQRLQNTTNPYFFGDESIAAATYYRVFTRQEGITSIATTDHDIKKLVRTAHILFETIDNKKFHEITATHTLKVYLPETHEGKPFYRPYLDTKLPQSMGDMQILEKILGAQRINAMLEIAYHTFNKIC